MTGIYTNLFPYTLKSERSIPEFHYIPFILIGMRAHAINVNLTESQASLVLKSKPALKRKKVVPRTLT